METKTKRIETKRLILRQFKIEDAGAMYRNWASDPAVTKYLMWPTYTSEEMAVERMRFMMDQYEKGGVSDWAIELKEIGEVIGSIGVVSMNEAAQSVHVGYCIGQKWWHQGITSEALAAVIEYFFTETEVLRVDSRHAVENPNSGAVMKKCGMRYEGTLRKSDWCNQGICDAAWYGILKDEWMRL